MLTSAAAQDAVDAEPPKEAVESLYVIEQLVVSVHSTSDGSGERIGQVQSGDRVVVLAREGDQAHVRLESGEEGWMKASYLSPNPPLRDQLRTKTAEVEKLRTEKAKLESELASARKAADAANAALAQAKADAISSGQASGVVDAKQDAGAESDANLRSVASDASEPAELSGTMDAPVSTSPPLFASQGFLPARPTWIAASVFAIATLAIGFALGWRMLDRRIRAKYGGLRIY